MLESVNSPLLSLFAPHPFVGTTTSFVPHPPMPFPPATPSSRQQGRCHCSSTAPCLSFFPGSQVAPASLFPSGPGAPARGHCCPPRRAGTKTALTGLASHTQGVSHPEPLPAKPDCSPHPPHCPLHSQMGPRPCLPSIPPQGLWLALNLTAGRSLPRTRRSQPGALSSTQKQ